jgi:hypothetical protein
VHWECDVITCYVHWERDVVITCFVHWDRNVVITCTESVMPSLRASCTESDQRVETDVPIAAIKLQGIRRSVNRGVPLMATEIPLPSIDSLLCKFWIHATEFCIYIYIYIYIYICCSVCFWHYLSVTALCLQSWSNCQNKQSQGYQMLRGKKLN